MPTKGQFITGRCTFKLTFNVWTINGVKGNINPVVGGPNLTMELPIAEYVKNVLRGRERWGVHTRIIASYASPRHGRSSLGPASS